MKYELTASRLKEALDKKGIRPQDLANRSGVSKASISQYLNGTHAPSNISSGKMARVLGVSAPWLMGYDVDPNMSTSMSAEEQAKAIEFYEWYKSANPDVQAAIELLLKPQKP